MKILTRISNKFHLTQLELTSALIAIYLLTLRIYQFRQIPYGSPDDTFLAATSSSQGGLWKAALAQADSQGRFYQVIFTFLTQIPYRVIGHDFLWTVIGSQIVLFNVALYLAIQSILKQKIYAITAVILFNSLYDFRGGYNSISSFPLWFCFSLTLFLFSIRFVYLSHNSISRKSKHFARIIGVCACSFASLAYESLLFLPVLLIILDYIFWNELQSNYEIDQKVKRYLKIHKATLFFFATFFCSYAIGYITFRNSFPSSYPGVKISLASPSDILFTIIKMSFAGFNAPWYFTKIDLRYFMYENATRILFYALIFLLACIQIRKTKITKYNYYIQMLLLTTLALLPNALYGFTERYRGIAENNPLYLGALFSSPSIIFAILLTSRKILNTRPFLSNLFIVAGSSIFALAAVINNNNIADYSDQIRNRNITWNLVDKLTEINQRNLLQNKVVLSDLNSAINSHETYGYWQYYISSRIGKDIEVIDQADKYKIHSLILLRERESATYLLVLSSNPLTKDLILKRILSNDRRRSANVFFDKRQIYVTLYGDLNGIKITKQLNLKISDLNSLGFN